VFVSAHKRNSDRRVLIVLNSLGCFGNYVRLLYTKKERSRNNNERGNIKNDSDHSDDKNEGTFGQLR
jgi:hypothetical protein